jgi:NADPH-dependent 2,4-dienoyl-CoA reductase/sulfur reductase-like enzyme
MSARFDVVVVGAGPGGMAAATMAAEAGCRVCLLDDNAAPGGQIWRGFKAETARKYPHGGSFIQWAASLECSGCVVDQGWQVIDHPKPGLLRLERVDGCGNQRGNERGNERGEGRREIGFEKLIVATGARERFLPFPGWTLPGVMGAGGLQALVKSGLDPQGKRVVLAGSGPLLLAVGAGLASAGASVLGIYEQASRSRLAGFALSLLAHPGKLVEGARYRLKALSAAYRSGCWVVQAEGRGRVERVTLTDGCKQWCIDCDWLGCGFHLVPNLELPRLLGCRFVAGCVAVDRLQQSSVPGVFCVGELTGIGGLEKALIEGQIAGWAAAGREAEALRLAPERQRLQQFAARLDRAFALRPELRTLASAETMVCRCEDVPFSALESCANWRQAKLHTRCGMGACQGRVCGAATEFLFGWENVSARPPVFPAAVSTFASPQDAPELVDR